MTLWIRMMNAPSARAKCVFLILLQLFLCASNSDATCKITIGVAPAATDPTFSENCAFGAAALL